MCKSLKYRILEGVNIMKNWTKPVIEELEINETEKNYRPGRGNGHGGSNGGGHQNHNGNGYGHGDCDHDDDYDDSLS